MRNFGPPGLTLLGFKPRGWLTRDMQVTKSSFLFPDEAVSGVDTRDGLHLNLFSLLLSPLRTLTSNPYAMSR